VVITGAASGLGRAAARRFSAEGASVFGIDVNEVGLAETEAMVVADGGRFGSTTADIGDRLSAHGAVAAALDEMGRIDVVANVAGVLRAGHTPDITEEDLALVFGVNVAGTLWTCQAAIPHLLDSAGCIVNVASNTALKGQAYTALYAASKAAVANLTRSLAMEYAKTPLRVNAVAPGGIETPMTTASPFPDDVDWKLLRPALGYRGMSPAEDIAAVICFVASDDARALHGAIVSADLGLTAG
jgi:NAD(P)-dependent dehydrogenase (short-subunit alcohol dehydrogenase family)